MERETAPRQAPADTPEVVVTWPDYDLDDLELGGALQAAGCRVRLEPKRGARSPADLARLLGGAAAAIVSTDPFNREVIEAVPDLRVIARVGVGFDSIDISAATEAGIVVTITPGANESTVADHTVAMALSLLRRLGDQDTAIRAGEWRRTGKDLAGTLSGATVGLIGYGHIGQLVAERLRPFGAEIVAYDPHARGDDDVTLVELDELLRRSQVVSVHCPLLPETRGLIGAEELALMQPDAILLNTARGEIVDEAALISALRKGELRGAGLDVFEQEPPASDSPLRELPNVLLSPHNAGLSQHSVAEMTRRATSSVIDVLGGRVPADVANEAVISTLGLETASA
jgi:phosphoglycerate dehydrogenase-like enzyme